VDSPLGAVPLGAPDEWESIFEADLNLPPPEAVLLSDESLPQDPSDQASSAYDPSQNLTDIFSGLTEDSDSTSEEEPALTEGFNAFKVTLSLADNSSLSWLPGLQEIMDTRLAKPVYDYFNDATDPPDSQGSCKQALEIIQNREFEQPILTGENQPASGRVSYVLNSSADRRGEVRIKILLEVSSDSVNNAWALSFENAELKLIDQHRGAILLRKPVAEISEIYIRGPDEIDDRLTVDLSKPPVYDLDIIFDGGSGGDRLIGDNVIQLHARIDATRTEHIEIEELIEDELEAGADHDVLEGGRGPDTLIGDNSIGVRTSIRATDAKHIEIEELIGDDLELDGGDDFLDGDGNDDTLIGDNAIELQARIRAIRAEHIEIEQLIGDDLEADAGHDVLQGRAGDDTLFGDNRVRTQTRVEATDGKRVEIEDLIGDDLELKRRTDHLDGGRGHNLLIEDNVVRQQSSPVPFAACALRVCHFVFDLADNPVDNPNRHISVSLHDKGRGRVKGHVGAESAKLFYIHRYLRPFSG
jgi:hypothetical protein